MVRAMYHGVTVRALPAQELLGGTTRRETRAAVECGRVIGLAVALLAQERLPDLQHAGLVGAVRVMAIGAVFRYRLMFPQERTALVGVALIAGLIDRMFLQVGGRRRAMRVMAVGADHLALPDRVVRDLVAVRSLILVAGPRRP